MFTNSTAATTNNCTNCTLYPFRKYSVTVQCENSAGVSNSTKIISKTTNLCILPQGIVYTVILLNYIGTHKIQNKNIIRMSPALSGTVNASCCIATNYGDMITGCLAIYNYFKQQE